MSRLCQDVTREALHALSVAVAAKTNAQEELDAAIDEMRKLLDAAIAEQEKLRKENALLINVIKHFEAIEDSKDLLVAALAKWELSK
jgi:hypothetical protein